MTRRTLELFLASTLFALAGPTLGVEVLSTSGPSVQNGAIVEVHEGRCTSASHYGAPWRVWAVNGEWRIESPEQNGPIYGSIWPLDAAMRGCGES